MVHIGTPFSATAKKVLLCGAGELGKEVAIELKRLGCEVIACDRYENAPAMQIADRSYHFSMLNGDKLRQVILTERPDMIVPEIEAIATDVLVDLEKDGFNVIPTARAAQLTMNREGIRRLVAEDLGVKTSQYKFADNQQDFEAAIADIGFPCIVKPIMSSSGKGQSTLHSESDVQAAWVYAQEGGRSGAGKVIIEAFVDFDYEITLLTVRHRGGTSFCSPIGHRQEAGDYQESWQPQAMSPAALLAAQEVASKVTEELGGYGLFGVELFIKGDDVIFSEVSPRPHDTGLVTLISQNLSEFALHARAILGLPIANIDLIKPSASKALVVKGTSDQVSFSGLEHVLAEPGVDVKLFGKPEVNGSRRMGVLLAQADSVDEAVIKVVSASQKLTVALE